MESRIQVLYFGAEYCAMCRTAKPLFKETCEKLGLKEGPDYNILDTDECDNNLLVEYGIRSIPVVVIKHIDGGEVIFKGHAMDGIEKLKEYGKENCD